MISLNLQKKAFGLQPSQVFMLSALLVNAGNYLYNLLLGRVLGPEIFADAAILITFLLILSFLAMTLQLGVAKFTGVFDGLKKEAFLKYARKWSLIIGTITGVIIIALSSNLQLWLNTSSPLMFMIFGAGVPFYFLMSVNRGFFQGEEDFIKLSITYQGEMLSRLLLTLLFVVLLPFASSELVAAGIFFSFIPGLIPFKKISGRNLPVILPKEISHLKKFLVVTAFYELTQILINNGDILLVKHFFESHTAGLYASLALIGRLVYFVAWMFVMLLLPAVVKRAKEGLETTHIFFKYLGMIWVLATLVVTGSAIFPELIVKMMFGGAYLEIAGLLWKYALASSLFALANVFVYYFLSLDKYLPVFVSGFFGMLQLGSIAIFHQDLEQVVEIQIIAMTALLICQSAFFFYQQKKTARRN